MIKVQTKLKIIDNSGVKSGQVIKIYKGQSGQIGDIILISVKYVKSKTKLKISKGNIYKALIIRTKYKKKDLIGNQISFDENSAILLNKQNLPIASRILGPVPVQLRKNKQFKILSIASTII
jgi:large subunit ribosomal protein L14